MKKKISFIVIAGLIIISTLIVSLKDKKLIFLTNKKEVNEDLITFLKPQPDEQVNNPFLVKIKISDGASYVYKIRIQDLESNLWYEGQLHLEDGYFVDFVKITAASKLPPNAIIQIYRVEPKDEAQILLGKQTIRFKNTSVGLTNTDLLSEKKAFVKIKDKEFKAELANTLETRTIGLSRRSKMNEDDAMLFVFDNPAYHSFWMKDMKFDIDIIWIYYDTIIDIKENVRHPLTQNLDLELYSPKSKGNMVLEIVAGTASKYGFSIGDRVFIYK